MYAFRREYLGTILSQLFDQLGEVAVQHRRRVVTSVLNELGLKYTPIRYLWRGKRLRRMEQDSRTNPKPYSDTTRDVSATTRE
ncbi:unnamed protein product [Ectocarpus sp. 12 AP-2014]